MTMMMTEWGAQHEKKMKPNGIKIKVNKSKAFNILLSNLSVANSTQIHSVEQKCTRARNTKIQSRERENEKMPCTRLHT